MVASSAVTFQIMVLNPLHSKMSQQIEELDKKLNKNI